MFFAMIAVFIWRHGFKLSELTAKVTFILKANDIGDIFQRVIRFAQ